MQSWKHLNHLQVGKYAEYFVKMALVRAGFDVFNAEVDDKGVDFVFRVGCGDPRYYDIQVKSVRSRHRYVFMHRRNSA